MEKWVNEYQNILMVFLFLVAIAAIIFYISYDKRKKSLLELKLDREDIRGRKRNFQVIEKLFKVKEKELKKGEGFIDDQTFGDLELKKVFCELDFTLTTPGEQKLYEMLRTPLMEASEVKKRGATIKFFETDTETRDKIRKIFALLGRQLKGDIVDFMYLSEHKYVNKIFFDMLALMPIISIIIMWKIGIDGIFILMASMAVNIYIDNKTNRAINERILSIDYLSSIALGVKALSKIQSKELSEYIEELLKLRRTCDIILKNSSGLGRIRGMDAIGDYFIMVFLVEVRTYYKIMNKIDDSAEDLRKLYDIIGELDALSGIALYKEGISTISEPFFTEENNKLELTEAINPLIADGVPNSVTIGPKGIIITGSNMSGKSTFLRTIGINAILAQSLCFVTAKSYSCPLLRVISSISPKDDISQGKSYYLGEAEAMLRILKAIKGQAQCLCIIDEIFRGTNPLERIAASAEILRYLIKHKALAVVATHDLELTELTKEDYELYYFSEKVDDAEGISFDYKLKQGVSPTRNAIKLLKYLGYPEEIVTSAERQLALAEK